MSVTYELMAEIRRNLRRAARDARPGVYLLHFKESLPCRTGRRPSAAQHYLGSSDNIDRRVHEHASGSGARLTSVFVSERGIGFEVSAIWECATIKEARLLERRLKRLKNGRKLCPRCAA